LNPFDAWRFLAEAQMVMLRRSLALWAEPQNAAPALTRMAFEKHLAFSRGVAAAGMAMARGATPDAVMAAAIRPARNRVRRNVKGSGLA